MKWCLPVVLILVASSVVAADDPAVAPYRSGEAFTPVNRIDELLVASLADYGLKPAPQCTDAVFIRRVYIDVLGILPPPERVRRFLKSSAPDRREILIDELLSDHDAFAEYWTMKWCDLLRVKAEFPINLWPNGVQAYAHWIHTAMRDNMSYDEFARALLTSSGSNFRTPPVNFYRAVQGTAPDDLAAVVALTFMGMRFERMAPSDRENLSAFFSRVAFKGTAEWKETIVYLDPAVTEPLAVQFPDGGAATVPADEDPRTVFADWLLKPGNPVFARSMANRAWSWFFGYGLVHEPDDMRLDNPPVHPELLNYLTTEFETSGYDMQHLFRIILQSAAYQQSSIPVSDHADSERLFAQYPVRRLDAEVLFDAMHQLSGQTETYSSAVPEPFTFIPSTHSHKELVDGTITSAALKQFGRPPRDTGLEAERTNEMSKEARLAMLNSSRIHDQLKRSWKLIDSLARARSQNERPLDLLYLTVLSRYPTGDERKAAEQFMPVGKRRKRNATVDLLWALINTKEFLYRH